MALTRIPNKHVAWAVNHHLKVCVFLTHLNRAQNRHLLFREVLHVCLLLCFNCL
jgi:hypothetical protein